MTKKISVLLAFVALLFAELAFAQGAAVVTSAVGITQVQTGSGAPRALRVGDQVLQGDTISTGAASSVVLRFDDGEVTALTQNSRMTITAYQYEPASQKGNMLLSLVTGGMRAITGLLGRNTPDRVAYRAATTTIGIRGTDVSIGTDGTNVVISVTTGTIVVTLNGQDYVLNAGQAGYIQGNKFTVGPPPPALSGLGFAIRDLQGMTGELNRALAAQQATAGQGTGNTPGTQGPPGGSGGGSASVR
jgi:hypothetical protein